MITIKMKHLCYNCFHERRDGAGPCPYCGFDLEENVKKYPVALRAGEVLNNRYIVGRVLGQGGFGITYLAWDTKLQAKVAVKEFMPNEIATRIGTTVSVAMESRAEDFTYGAERFQEEARTLAKFMGQPGIAGVTDYFDENDTSYFVMDYIEGISFKTYIANQGGKVTVDEALNVMIPVLRALTAVHAEGFIHRDVTPDNIYISKDGNVKLLDFGSARYSIGDKSKSLDVILKVGYAPKEQYIRRGRQGPYTDVYSCAACFYAALTGYLPPESLERLDQDTLTPPSQAGVEIPQYLENAILKGLAVQPEDRFQSAAEFLDAIENQMVVDVPGGEGRSGSGDSGAVSGDGDFGQATGRKQKRPPFLMGGIAATAAVLVGIGVFMGSGQTRTEPAIATFVEEESSRQEDQPPLLQPEVPSITIRGEEYSTELRKLNLKGMNLEDSDLKDLRYMVNLTSLDLRENQITDLSPIAELTQLESLSLELDGEVDLTPLAGLTNLTSLTIEGDLLLEDLTVLSGLTQMKKLRLPPSPAITDLSPLSGMTQLTYLQIHGGGNRDIPSGITDLSSLADLTELKTLTLFLVGEMDLTPLASLSQLTELYLYGNLEVEDFTFLSGLSNLQTLHMEVKAAKSMEGLGNLPELRDLEITNANSAVAVVSDLAFLSGMPKLQTLRLNVNDISSFHGMENLTELREAWFTSSNIPSSYKDLEPLKNLKNLQVLELPGNESAGVPCDLSGLAGLTELRQLGAYCLVDSLESLAGLEKLTQLLVHAEADIDLSPVSHVSNVEVY